VTLDEGVTEQTIQEFQASEIAVQDILREACIDVYIDLWSSLYPAMFPDPNAVTLYDEARAYCYAIIPAVP
jgi:hypothetical protein